MGQNDEGLIKKEPISPFTDRVNELAATGVSTILVIGGSGEYLFVADKIYRMDAYRIHDVTAQTKAICTSHSVEAQLLPPARWKQNRTLYPDRFTSYPEGSGSEKLVVSAMGFILIGDEAIDIRGLRQTEALGYMLRALEIRNREPIIDLEGCINGLYDKIEREGLDTVFSSFFITTERFLDLPRKWELMAVINRMRKVTISNSQKSW